MFLYGCCYDGDVDWLVVFVISCYGLIWVFMMVWRGFELCGVNCVGIYDVVYSRVWCFFEYGWLDLVDVWYFFLYG